VTGDLPVCKCIASFSQRLVATGREKVLYGEWRVGLREVRLETAQACASRAVFLRGYPWKCIG